VGAVLARHRDRFWDAAPVVFVLALAFVSAVDAPSATPFDIAFALALVWRRRFPFWSFLAMAGIALVQWLCDVVAIGDVALLFGLYTVVAAERWRNVAVAVVLLEAGIVMAMLRFGNGGGSEWRGIISLSAMAAAAGAFGLNARSRRALVASLRERAARLEVERDQRAELAVAAERARIAREMHDVVAHNLSVMVALADGAAYQLDTAPDRSRDAMQRTSRTGRAALDEMRRLLGILRHDSDTTNNAPRTPQPGLTDLDPLLAQVRAAGLPVTLEHTGTAASAPQGIQLAAYRIVQEALTNILKHAGPGATAHVTLHADDTTLHLDITNTDTITSPSPTAGGAGLRGMRERAALYSGTITTGPIPDGPGWHVTATLPLSAESTPPSLLGAEVPA
jgi:signal transduction histidine kinase